MLTGVSFAIKDRRVDRMLSAEHLTPTEIYYSPLSVWFFVILYLCLAGGWIIFAIPFAYKAYILTGYLVAGYLCSAYMNCSFALTDTQLVVVNPNFPFRCLTCYELQDIRQLIIDMTSAKGHHFLLVFGDNFVKIHTDTSSKSYFCAGLEADAFDENWTEKTMEDFHSALKNRNIPVVWKLD